MRSSLSLIMCLLFVSLFVGCDALQEIEQQSGTVVIDPEDPVRETIIANRGRDFVYEMLVTPPEGEWLDPLPSLTWWESLEEGWNEVRKEGRPLLVLVHCPVSTSSGNLADEMTIPPPELSEVLRQFVTVKLTDA
jgi:hypothetical protein